MTSPEIKSIIADVREQILYLQELGVTELEAHLSERVGPHQLAARTATQGEVSVSAAAKLTPVRAEVPNIEVIRQTPAARPEERMRLSDLPSLSKRPSTIATEKRRVTQTSEEPKTPPPDIASAKTETLNDINDRSLATAAPRSRSGESIFDIRAEIGPDCTRCKLCALGRTKVVNSVGNFNAPLMFVGEAPGADEDALGEPFVGRAGQLLTKIIESIDLTRADVFIGNINRCRPPGNRAPEPDETVTCKPFLLREIAVVQPKVIVVLGATAAHNLLETKVPIGKLRGHFHDYQGTKVMPTFHPAYLLRDPHKKREVWEDMKLVRDYLTQQ
ncbi:MAG: uracil-DNA glycosylase [Acidobacteriota bacterium]